MLGSLLFLILFNQAIVSSTLIQKHESYAKLANFLFSLFSSPSVSNISILPRPIKFPIPSLYFKIMSCVQDGLKPAILKLHSYYELIVD